MNSFFDNAEDGDEDDTAVEGPFAVCATAAVSWCSCTHATINFVKGDCLGALFHYFDVQVCACAVRE